MEIRITNNVCECKVNNENELLLGLSILAKALSSAGINEDRIRYAIDLAFTDKKKIQKNNENRLKELFKKLGLENR